ncbi:hypothetical protein J14TS2_03090 [Bacillus sp. J14TS2]|uniref:M60 family metallopeptidase n=1 Tax=Bacillus sp. J14TS2 TaxID=2807188 RepID=UPI001B2E1FC9|nr:M60 family metallopeptidase [Bacillus sp. J14TS2]GIN69834.1 hypothetical protein J14TS2_03090 [Bacillus sp. J14TS2]
MVVKRITQVCLVFLIISSVAFSVSAEKREHVTKKVDSTPDSPIKLTENLQGDLAMFYQDLQGMPVYSGGGVAAIGTESFPVLSPEAISAVAAARYGKGRVAVTGSNQYFDLSQPHENDNGIFARNILLWLTDEGSANNGGGEGYTNRYEEALRSGDKKIRLVTNLTNFSVNSALPIEVIKVDNWTSASLDPENETVALIDGSMMDEDISTLNQYIENGGAAVVVENGSSLVGITRDTLLERRLLVGNYRGARLGEHFAVQKLLNQVGLSLLNSGVSAYNTPTVMTEEEAYNHHLLNRLHEAQALENGSIALDEIEIGEADADDNQKQKLLSDVVIEALESLSSESDLYTWAAQESEELEPAAFPMKRQENPYKNALYNFQFSHFTLDEDNTKSLYADDFPGKVAEDAKVINGREIEVDFDFPDTMYTRALPNKNWISTGLYAAPGKVVELEVPSGTENLTVQIGSHDDDLSGLGEWKRAPLVVHHKKLDQGINRVNSPYGGMIYLIPMKPKEDTQVKVKISGAIQAPYYELGKTTKEEWDQMQKTLSTPFAELKSDRINLVVPSKVIEDLENPEELMKTWDSIVLHYDELAGLSPDKAMPNKAHRLPYYYVTDRQIKGGAMHAGYPIMLTDNLAEQLVDVDYLTTKAWGFWHELGHEYEQRPWLFGDANEVLTNIYSLYIQEQFGNPSELLTKTDGKDYFERAFDYLNSENPGKKYGDNGHYEQLVLFSQLQLAFGWDLFTDLHTHYREMADDQLPNTNQEKIDEFVVAASKYSGRNLLAFFDRWVIGHSDVAEQRVGEMNLPEPEIDIWTLRTWNPGEVAPTEIILDLDELHLNRTDLGATVQAKVLPENAVKDIKWTSSDSTIATVSSNGYVSAISEGSAVITAESVRDPNISAEITVTVEDMEGLNIPIADAYVKDGGSANTNFGSDPLLSVKSDIAGFARRSYLKFNTGQIDHDHVESVVLRLYAESVNSEPERTIDVYITDHQWNESSITWNNAPEGSELLASTSVTEEGEWYEFDLTEYFKSNELSETASFLIMNPGPHSQKNDVAFTSREGEGNSPELLVKLDQESDPVVSAKNIKELVRELEKSGDFSNADAPHSLNLHLTAVNQFEDQEKGKKVVKHMESFIQLLDKQQENNLLSGHAYDLLKSNSESLIQKWR